MSGEVTRRDFLRLTAMGAGGIGVMQTLRPAEALDIARPSSYWNGRRVEEIPSICEMCFWRCGIVGKVDRGQLVKIEGNSSHPLNRGRLCARGNAGIQLLYDPDRLKYPMQRVGARGEGRFRRISWDDAFAIIGERLTGIKREYGPNAVAYFPHGISASFFKQVMNGFGSGMTTSASFFHCRGPRDVGYELTFGRGPGSPERCDFESSKAIVLIGSHIGENVHTSHVSTFIEGLSRGAKLITVDPRYSVAASKSDYWLAIRPGTDTALLLSWIHVLIKEKLYDAAYLDRYATGFTELAAAIDDYTPEWAAAETDIPADMIRETARLLGESRPAVVIHPGRHTTWYGNDTQRARAMAILTALLGAWGRPGSMFLPTAVPMERCPCSANVDEENVPMRDVHPFKHEGIPSGEIVRATLEQSPPVKAWIIYGQNICQSQPEPYRTMAALRKLDFVVAVEVLPTESVLWADIVLPEATYLERYDTPLRVTDAHDPFVVIRQPMVKPLFDTRDPFEIARGFAKALDVQDCFPCPDIESVVERMLGPLDVPLDRMRRFGVHVLSGNPYEHESEGQPFPTASGKIELVSPTLAARGFSAIPRYEAPSVVPDGFIRVVNGRSPVHTFTRTINNRWLNELQGENPVWLNDEVGRLMGLHDGDRVILENQDGYRTQEVPLLLTPAIRPDVLYIIHGFGSKSPLLRTGYNKGASDTCVLTRIATDPETGAAGIRVNAVRIVHAGRVLDVPSVPVKKAYVKRAERKRSSIVSGLAATVGRENAPKPEPVKPRQPPSGHTEHGAGRSEGC